MYPELFKIPYIDLPVPTYGLMMVIGFLFAVYLIRRLSRDITPNLEFITNACLYSLIAGVIGARLFYVVHYFDQFRDRPASVFAVWEGGLEFLGGVVLAIVVLIFYLRWHKLSIRRYFDVLAIGLMLGLAFGRIGCFLKGDCFGRPSKVPLAVRFPYGSDPYRSQVYPNLKRNRPEHQLELPVEFFNYSYGDTVPTRLLKPYELLTRQQKDEVDKGKCRILPVHPTQLYSSVNAAVLCLILYLFRRRAQSAAKSKNSKKLFAKPGCTFALMFILYGIARFFLEFLRDDNPFEYGWWVMYKGGTVSQNLGIYLAILGVVLMVVFQKIEPKVVVLNENNNIKTEDKNS
ncbi:MAG TPA: prolipoprotein diacylglyceryl transferase [Sedimentisphaerales bacterium]|nr:prolipoprotein diacylglyceryl transferase [Sedimentisphaerales bacterium]